MAGSGKEGAPPLTDRQRTVAFATVLVAFVLEVADSTIVNTALPAIRTALGASPSAMQWIVAGYFLSLGSILLLGGRLGDAFGYRRMFLTGVTAFVLSSALCGLAQTPAQLVVARLVQGAAGAVMGPQVMAIVQHLFTPLERVSKLAWFGVIGGLAAIIGPIVGGVLIELNLFGLGWRLIFLVNLPIGAIAFWAGLSAIPRDVKPHQLRIDLAGALLFGSGFGLALLALIQGRESNWPVWAFASAACGLSLVAAGWRHAVRRKQRGEAAIIEPALFRLRTFFWGLLTVIGFSAASAGFLLVFAISLQQGLGLSPLQAALIHMPFGLGVMGGISLIGRRYLPRFGRWLLIAGVLIMVAGVSTTLAMIATGHGGGAPLIAVLRVTGIGMGMLAGPLPPVIVADVDRAHAGTASATVRTAQQLGGALGIAIVGAAYFAAGGEDAAARLAGLGPGGVAIFCLLTFALLCAFRLPTDIFGVRGRPLVQAH